MWTKKEHLPTSPLSGLTDHAKELFEIHEMRSLTPDYFERFGQRQRQRDTGTGLEPVGSWMIGLLHGTDRLSNPAPNAAVALTPVVMLVTEQDLVVFDEASTEVVLSSSWDRMCRIELKPVEEGNYQVFALSYLAATLSVSERLPDELSTPLDASEIGVHYLYTHANPSTFEVIDRYWSRTHIPQHLHRLPSLLR